MKIFRSFLKKRILSPPRSSSHYLKWVTHGLIFSVSLNIAFLVTFIYKGLAEPPPHPLASFYVGESLKPPLKEKSFSLLESYQSMTQRSYPDLMHLLRDASILGEGIQTRDLALAVLVQNYFFDLERSLGAFPYQRIRAVLGDSTSKKIQEVTLYPGLSGEAWQQLYQFVKKERWPLRSEGLFVLLSTQRQKKGRLKSSLVQDFFLTEEFLAFDARIRSTFPHIPKPVVLALALEGGWQVLSHNRRHLELSQEVSPKQARKLLKECMEHGSSLARVFLVKRDPVGEAKKLNHEEVLLVLEALPEKMQESELFCLELLTSPRGESVWERAAAWLYAKKGEKKPSPYEHARALRELVPASYLKEKLQVAFPDPKSGENNLTLLQPEVKEEPVEEKPALRLYRVQEGDSLWKIANRFSLDVKELKKKNGLSRDEIYVGQELVIP